MLQQRAIVAHHRKLICSSIARGQSNRKTRSIGPNARFLKEDRHKLNKSDLTGTLSAYQEKGLIHELSFQLRPFSTNSSQISEDNSHNIKKVNEEKNEEGEYILQHIPSSSGYATSSPMEKLLESWAEAATTHSISKKNTDISTQTSIANSSETDLPIEVAMQQTLSWLGQVTKQPLSSQQQGIISTETFNTVLKVLSNMTAKTIPSIFHEKQSENERNEETVEEVATHILQQMKSTDNQSSRPNITTYNNYIACLRGHTPLETATHARMILNELQSVSNNALTPNVETYNAVLKWYAMDIHPSAENNDTVDMTTINEIYKEMTEKMGILPNYETFQIILHACTKKICLANNFCFNPFIRNDTESEEKIDEWNPYQAQIWIERMVNTLGNDSIDLGIWNLTLPYVTPYHYPSFVSAMTENFAESRYSSPDWKWRIDCEKREHDLFPDNMKKKIRSPENERISLDFVSPTDPKIQHAIESAQKLEQWVEYITNNISLNLSLHTSEDKNMDKSDKAPDINIDLQSPSYPNLEAYNAIIIAWAMTRTKEGLLRAESWALQALDVPHLREQGVHVNMFLPILTAWSLCGEEFGVKRVEEWIEKFEELSTLYKEKNKYNEENSLPNNHVVVANSHVLHAAVAGWRMFQLSLLKERKKAIRNDPNKNPKELEEAIVHAANQGTIWLKKLCDLNHDQSMYLRPLDASVFGTVIDLWYSVGVIQLQNKKQKNHSIIDCTTEKIINIIELMNSKIVKDGDECDQMFDLFKTYHHVYATAIQHIAKIKYTQKSLQHSHFVTILQMLYISDILYPYLSKTHENPIRNYTSLYEYNKALLQLSTGIYDNVDKSLVSSATCETNDDDVNSQQKEHPYTNFYNGLLKLLNSKSVSEGSKMKIYTGIIDRLSRPNSLLNESHLDATNIWICIIKQNHLFNLSINERKEIMELILKHGFSNKSKGSLLFNNIEDTMRHLYKNHEEKNAIEKWIQNMQQTLNNAKLREK